MEYLFVYGLLREKAKHEMSNFLHNNASFISPASFQGKLYLVDYYPGVIPSNSAEDIVYGDLFSVQNQAIFEQLDHFEGMGSAFDFPYEYRREQQQVVLPNQSLVEAWIYLYNWDTNGLKPLKSGDFLKEYR